MNIRTERPDDRDTVYQLIQTAFATARVSDGDEQDYYLRLLTCPDFIPELALVAEQDGLIIGHTMLTTSVVRGRAGTPVLVLSPLSVLPEYQGQGVGTALVDAVLDRARKMDYQSVFLAGDTEYYSRFGFVPVRHFGINPPAWVPAENYDNIMALELVDGGLDDVGGTIEFMV